MQDKLQREKDRDSQEVKHIEYSGGGKSTLKGILIADITQANEGVGNRGADIRAHNQGYGGDNGQATGDKANNNRGRDAG